jgi:hypothetical protein
VVFHPEEARGYEAVLLCKIIEEKEEGEGEGKIREGNRFEDINTRGKCILFILKHNTVGVNKIAI